MRRFPSRLGATSLTLLLLLPCNGGAAAASLEVQAGWTQLDSGLTDFGWEAGGSSAWGLHGRMNAAFASLGARFRQTGSSLATGFPGSPDSRVDTRVRTLEATVGVALPGLLGVSVEPHASLGLVHVGYDPDRIGPIEGVGDEIRFGSDTELLAGAGISLRRSLIPRLALGLNVDASTYSLETAHRRGDEIVRERRGFWNWHAGIGLVVNIIP